MMHKYNYQWKLSQLPVPTRGKVFSCFACGGGSSMGYKLAGFDVVGCNEIDPRMAAVYKKNLNPKYIYVEDIREFVAREDYPLELYQLDILDGSPPCSSFSIAGKREKLWGVEHKFREGQKKQVLDTLFFDFIQLAKRLQPKVVVAENVKGLLLGKAKSYVRQIYDGFDDAGYYCQHWLLNAQNMGVPQRRERVFFICLRKDLIQYVPTAHILFEELPRLNMVFNERPILFKEFADYKGKEIKGGKLRYYWENKIPDDDGMGDTTKRLYGVEKYFNSRYDKEDMVCHTLTAKDMCVCYNQPRKHSVGEICCISSFPQDYNFDGQKPHYVCGMSVPPVMLANIANKIWEQWLCRITN